ncbi:permease prefix domain 1-containing protein [Clostridium haemolyticum]|nr:permease prefix domain 1-containing protein [Clostridium haemolyticum]
MKNHLLQLVEELKSKGKSEDESISIAIKQFGEKKTN